MEKNGKSFCAHNIEWAQVAMHQCDFTHHNTIGTYTLINLNDNSSEATAHGHMKLMLSLYLKNELDVKSTLFSVVYVDQLSK